MHENWLLRYCSLNFILMTAGTGSEMNRVALTNNLVVGVNTLTYAIEAYVAAMTYDMPLTHNIAYRTIMPIGEATLFPSENQFHTLIRR